MRVPATIGMLLMLVILAISDFDIGDFPDTKARWDQQQAIPLATIVDYVVEDNTGTCLAIKLPEEVLTGSDMACLTAARIMDETMGDYEVECLYIVNDGWIPTSENPVDREWVDYLLTLDGGPGTLSNVACEDCPFTKLERCPDCVRHFDELYRQTYDDADE